MWEVLVNYNHYGYNKDKKEYDENEKESGHSVIVCGYSYGDFDDDGAKEYQLKIYDCNSYNSFSKGAYSYMYVADDYSSFDFADANMSSVEERLEHIWTNMSFWGVDAIRDSDWITKLGFEETTSARAAVPAEDSNQVDIMVTAYQPFKLVNAEGAILSYNGESYEGDMTIHASKIVDGMDDYMMILTVDASDSFTLTEYADNFMLSTEIDGGYYMASTVGADKILLSKNEDIVIEGADYTFSSARSITLSSCEYVKISGKSNGICKLISTEDGLLVEAEEGASDVVVETYQGIESSEEKLEDVVTNIVITDDEDGNTQIDGENKPHTHTPAETVIENEVPATCTTDGSYDSVVYCSVCGDELSREQVIVPALGHSYGEPVFDWKDNNSACTATFSCEAGDDRQTLDCEVTSVTTEATTREDGQIAYTASVTFNGQTYTDTKTVVIPATGSVDPGYNPDYGWKNWLSNLLNRWFGRFFWSWTK